MVTLFLTLSAIAIVESQWAGGIFATLSLKPFITVYNYEYFRLITYPFLTNNLLNTLFIATFGVYFFVRLEKLLGSLNYLLIFVSFTLVFGLTYVLSGFNSINSIAGLDAFFVYSLLLYSFINIEQRINRASVGRKYTKKDVKPSAQKSKVSPSQIKLNSAGIISNVYYTLGKNISKSYIFFSVVLTLWLFKSLSYLIENPLDTNQVVFNTTFTLCFGLVSSWITKRKIDKIVKEQQPYAKNVLDTYLKEKVVLQEEFVTNSANKKDYSNGNSNSAFNTKTYENKNLNIFAEEEILFLFDDELTDEEKIDEILDRMNALGKENITEFETTFLKAYSQHQVKG